MSSEHGLFTEEELRALVERNSRFSQRIAELEAERDEAVAQVASWRDWAEDVIDELALLPEWGHTAQLREQGIKLFDNPLPAAAALLREIEAGRALREWLSKFDEHHQAEDFLGSQDLWTENLWFQSPNSEYVRLRDAYDSARGEEK